ncbi:MAG: TonB-dependent receptor [Melioribacteraceae bacterium]
MKKLVFILLFAISFSQVYSQNEQNQTIELPDFVITGKRSVDIQSVPKSKAELITIVNNEFFIPKFSSDEVPLLSLESGFSNKYKYQFPSDYFSGRLRLGGGNVVLPDGEFFAAANIQNFKITGKVWGSRITDYVPYSKYDESGAAINNTIFFDTKSSFLPGSIINIGGQYFRNAYSFHSAGNLYPERKTTNGSISFEFKNRFQNYINFDFQLSVDNTGINEFGLSETLLNGKGDIFFRYGDFQIGGDLDYKIRKYDDDFSNYSDKYISLTPVIKFNPSTRISIVGGLTINSDFDGATFLPYGLARYEFADGFLAFAELSGKSDFFSIKDFLSMNRYFDPLGINGIFRKNKFSLTAGLRYQLKDFIDISLKSSYNRYNNFPYFANSISAGKFEIRTKDAVDKLSFELSGLINSPIMGTLSADLRINKITDENGFYLPYTPKIKGILKYDYQFSKVFSAGINYNLLSDYYSEEFNLIRIKDFHNFGVQLNYYMIESIQLTANINNLFDNNNYYWENYLEQPLGVSLNLIVRW